VTEAVLKLEGTRPSSREELIMSTMVGHRTGRQALTRAVGMGSSEQVEALALVTSLVTWSASTGAKEERQWWGWREAGGTMGCGWGASGRGGAGAESWW